VKALALQEVAQQSLPGLDPFVMLDDLPSVSDATRRALGLSRFELWTRYFELGGMNGEAEVERCLRGNTIADPHDHDVLAHALNERLAELGSHLRVEYATARPRTAPSTASVAPMMELDLLGSFRLRRDGEPVRLAMNSQRLLCFLALHDGFLLRHYVAGSLWGDTTDRQAAGSLRSALWRLGVLTPVLIEIADAHMRLFPSVRVDVRASDAFARRVLEPEQELSGTDLEDARLAEDLLPDWTEDWVLTRRDHHTQLRVRALEALCLRLSAAGRAGAAVQAGMLATAGDPLRESAHRALVIAHLSEGNLAAAAKQYAALRWLLWEELGVEPSAETKALVAVLPMPRA
jgi:DNA-binding SARP family transcriptional activator